MKVVSFSVWGDLPKYCTGMIRNAELCARVYPGWECRVYCGASVPADAVAALAAFPHVRVVRKADAGDWAASLWRFEAAADRHVEVSLFRDADSRVNDRERAAVDAWLASGTAAHVMRDHPLHEAPMLAGMWGLKGGVLPDLVAMIEAFPREDRWQTDQEFLAGRVWPQIRSRAMQHDEYFARRPFPSPRRGRQFVGQPFNEHDRPEIEGPTVLERHLRRAMRGVLVAAGWRLPLPRFD